MCRLSAPLAVLCCLAALPASGADSNTEMADREFQAAHRDFKAGNYESALRRYQTAYRLAPHPNILYNLALTYERLLDYDAAIAAFERFLAAAPSRDPEALRTERPLRLLAERALRRLRALPARIWVSAIPEQVEVSISPQLPDDPRGTPRWQGTTPTVFTVPAGRYLLRFHRPGYFDEEVPIEPRVGQALLVQRHMRYRPRALSVASSPPARLYLDDRLLGWTPLEGSVDVGTHRLRLERRFYIPHLVQLEVKPGQTPLRYQVELVQNARFEVVLGAALAGAGLGLVALRTLQEKPLEQTRDHEVYLPLFAAVLPAALGAGLVLLGVNQVPASQAQMILGNTTWGALLGLGLGFGVDPFGILPHWLATGGGIVGATAALAVERWIHPTSGRVALYNSAALWGATLGGLTWAYLISQGWSATFIGNVEGSGSSGNGGWALLVGTASGIGTGALLASLRPLRGLSRRQVALIDLGGLLGGAVAGSLGLGIGYGATQSWREAARAGILTAVGGIAAGLVGAALLTRLRIGGPSSTRPSRALQLTLPSVSLTPQSGGIAADLTLLGGVW
ncbi:MAG: PEGA domain-containing protein [Myxococcales bacterium]|nr:PEGA domain-containing protein [Myxococcota bacterium]MDW8280828.1 PEGA domain-containing protein [Myxococcales bacterium]